jgi:hypothetical protein
MLSFASDFWPLFWTMIGGGALVTAALSLLVATFSPAWFRPHRPALTLESPAGWHDHQAGREAKAA